MKQTFMVVINSDNEIEIGQIGVPIMKSLGLETINIEKAAQQSVKRTAGIVCEKHGIEWCVECFPALKVDFTSRR